MISHIHEKIINILKEKRVVTIKDISEELERSREYTKKQLDRLVMDGKIDYKCISGLSKAHSLRRSSPCSFMKKYVNTRIYFINENELRRWVFDQLPHSSLTQNRISLTNQLKVYGINLNFDVEEGVSDNTYENISDGDTSNQDILNEANSLKDISNDYDSWNTKSDDNYKETSNISTMKRSDSSNLLQDIIPVDLIIHLSAIAKNNELLTPNQAKALYDIAKGKKMEWNLSLKQISYLDVLIKIVVEHGNEKICCGNSMCERCAEIQKILRNIG